MATRLTQEQKSLAFRLKKQGLSQVDADTMGERHDGSITCTSGMTCGEADAVRAATSGSAGRSGEPPRAERLAVFDAGWDPTSSGRASRQQRWHPGRALDPLRAARAPAGRLGAVHARRGPCAMARMKLLEELARPTTWDEGHEIAGQVGCHRGRRYTRLHIVGCQCTWQRRSMRARMG